MGTIYKRGGRWWVAYTRDGQRFFESARNKATGTKGTYEDAKRLLANREGDVAKGLPVSPEIGRTLFADALDDVLRDQRVNKRRAVDSTARRIKLHLKPFFTTKRIAEITTTQIRAFARHRVDEGAQPATVNRDLAVIRRALRLAHRAGHILALPHVEMLDESRNVRQGFLEPDDFEKVRAALTPPVYADVAAFAYLTGWRVPSEVLVLEWRQVDQRRKLIRIDRGVTKGDEGRQFPITAALRDILERREAAKVKECALVFHRDGTPIHRRLFSKQWTEACTTAGVKDRIPHDMRRSAVRQLERARVPRQVAMRLVGYRTESIYRRYAIVSEADVHHAGASLDALATVTTSLHFKRSTKSGGHRRRGLPVKNTQ
jgi:integrase